MRVLVNAASAKRGGIVTYTQNLISFMIDKGIDVTVAVPTEFQSAAPSTLMAVRAGNFGPAKRLAWEQLVWRRRVARLAPDILFSSANFGLFKSPVPQVLLMREGGLFDRLYMSHVAPSQGTKPMLNRFVRRKLMLMSTRHADHVITPSKAMRDSLLTWDAALADKTSVNYYGARPDLFKRPPTTRRWREDGVLKLLYVSVYYPHKCPRVLCDAVDLLNARGIPARATITMTLDELANTPGAAQDRIVMNRALASGRLTMGHQSYETLPELYANHDAFVFPSVSETFGHPMVEAMASELPIIAASTQINREICADGALYFKPFSPQSLVDQLMELDGNPDGRRLRAKAGRSSVGSAFTWEDHVDRLIDVFDNVARGARYDAESKPDNETTPAADHEGGR